MLPTPDRVFFHEGESDLSLARADTIGEDDSPVPVDDAEGPTEAILLKRRQVHRLRRLLILVQLVAEELQQGAEVHGSRVEEADVGEEEVVEIVLVVARFFPQRVEPVDGPFRDFGIVVDEAKFQILPHSGRRQVRRGDQGGTRVDVVAEQVGLAVQELLDVATDIHVGTLQPFLDGEQLLERSALRKPREISFLAKGQERSFEEGRGELSTEARARSSAQQEPRRSFFIYRHGKVVEATEVNVASGHRQPVAVFEIFG